jgi:protein-S-isoprenylcysteine O-methyltransferase Ste14
MALTPSAEQPPETAGVAVPPPVLYLAGLGLGLALDRRLKSAKLPPSVGRPTAAALLIAGVALGARFVGTFRGARTAIDLRKPSTNLVTSGIYRYSRNPGYLSLTAIYLGVTAAAGGMCSVVSLIPVLGIMDRYVIRREEAYLSERFGSEYRAYTASVRRWL